MTADWIKDAETPETLAEHKMVPGPIVPPPSTAFNTFEVETRDPNWDHEAGYYKGVSHEHNEYRQWSCSMCAWPKGEYYQGRPSTQAGVPDQRTKRSWAVHIAGIRVAFEMDPIPDPVMIMEKKSQRGVNHQWWAYHMMDPKAPRINQERMWQEPAKILQAARTAYLNGATAFEVERQWRVVKRMTNGTWNNGGHYASVEAATAALFRSIKPQDQHLYTTAAELITVSAPAGGKLEDLLGDVVRDLRKAARNPNSKSSMDTMVRVKKIIGEVELVKDLYEATLTQMTTF